MTGAMAPAAEPVREALDHWAQMWSTDPAYIYQRVPEEMQRTREVFAALVGADPDEVAIMDNTSRGSNLIVQMIDPAPGSNIVVDQFTYPSSVIPWRLPAKANVELRYVPARANRIHLEDLAGSIDERTVAVSISHVAYNSGFRHDLEQVSALAHSKGAYLIVDASQSGGAIHIDARGMGIDFLSCCAMKWLLGTPGIAFLYIAREHADRMIPPQAGWAGVNRAFEREPEEPLSFPCGASRNEIGMPSLSGLEACRRGMEIILRAGTRQVEEHVVRLSGHCVEGLLRRGFRPYTQLEEKDRGGVIGMPVTGGADLVQFLRERAVDVWGDSAGTLLALHTHVFNDFDDVDRFLKGVDDYAKRYGWSAIQGNESK